MSRILGVRPAQENEVVFTFGSGLNTRSDPTEIRDDEAANPSHNYDLDVDNGLLRRRLPFDLVATATNGKPVRGAAQVVKADGSVSTIIQAGSILYEWDGASTFTQRGTVNSAARIRGVNWELENVVIIYDLQGVDIVKEWDGTTLTDMQHNISGRFLAKHVRVENERAWYFNVKTSTSTPHLLVGSKRGDFRNLTVTNRGAFSTNGMGRRLLPREERLIQRPESGG